jgi:hypothetical protein
VQVPDEPGVDAIREDPLAPQRRDVRVEALDVRQTPAEDDDVRVQNIDDMGKRAREPRLVTGERRKAAGIAGRRAG